MAIKSIHNLEDALAFNQKLRFLKKEYLSIVCLNSHNRLIHEEFLTSNCQFAINLNLYRLFEILFEKNAKKFILFHNHPSGVASPSQKDLLANYKIKFIAKYLNIEFLDQIIICQTKHYSFRLNGLI